MKRPPKKPKRTDELVVWVQTVAKRQGLTERRQAELRGVSTATIRRAKATPLTRDMLARYAPPSPVAQPPKDTAKLAALLSADDAPESEPDFIADLFAAQAEALEDPAVEAERQRLSAALSDADTHDEMNAIELEISRLDPVTAHYLDQGDSRVLALSTAGHSPLCLSRPEDLADLARLVTHGPDLEQEPGESDEDFARCIGARRLRAIELLTQALTLVVTETQP